MKNNTPVGKAQQTVLDALGKKADTWQEACSIFEKAGITVGAKRVGRNSVPVVAHARGSIGGAFNEHGEGESWDLSQSDVIDIVKQWM